MATSWPRIFLVYGIGIVGAGQLGIVPPLVPALQSAFDLSLAAAGMTVSIVTLSVRRLACSPEGGRPESAMRVHCRSAF